MKVWIYRFILFVLLFGVSPLSQGGNALSPLLDKVINGSILLSIPGLIACYFWLPRFYKVLTWPILIGVILMVLEAKYEYGQYFYSYFVIKRFAVCGIALCAFYVTANAGLLKIKYAANLILIFYLINQIFLGQIFSYSLTSESRTVSAPDAQYLVIPFLYYLVLYLKDHSLANFFKTFLCFALIVFLLHRSVISAAALAAALVIGLAMIGKFSAIRLPVWRTMAVLAVLAFFTTPILNLLPSAKTQAFLDTLGGIFSPKEDETGSWRVEQSEYYLGQVPEKPLFGWRYEGYDRGEVMVHEDFPEKGTIIHSQYVDMIYNYGIVGLLFTTLIILGTLIAMYVRNRTFSVDQIVLFGFLISGLVFGISYQLPVYFWTVVGIAMFFGLYPPREFVSDEEDDTDEPGPLKTVSIDDTSLTVHNKANL